MTTLRSGERQTTHLPAYHAITITATEGGSGSVVRMADKAGGQSQGTTAVAVNGSLTVGPFAVPTRHEIVCAEGVFTYNIAPVDFPTLSEMLDYWINQSPLYVIPRKGAVDLEHLIFEYVGEGPPAASAKAALDVNPDGDDNALTFTAASYGPAGNGISVAYVDPGVPDAALAVTGVMSENGFAITVWLATDENGDIISTAAEIKAAVEAEMDGWVTVDIDTSDSGDGDDGSGVVTAMAAANLEGGAGVGCGEAGKGSRYTDYDTPGLYINTGDADQPVWTELVQAE